MDNPYKALDAWHTMCNSDIRVAYKRAAQRAHPDKPTGSPEAFEAVRTAFEVVATPAGRRRVKEALLGARAKRCASCNGAGFIYKQRGFSASAKSIPPYQCPTCCGLGYVKG